MPQNEDDIGTNSATSRLAASGTPAASTGQSRRTASAPAISSESVTLRAKCPP